MSNPRVRIDPARQAALDLLTAVRRDDAYANLVMPGILRSHSLSGRDAAFATELGYGALRWQGWYDAVLQKCVSRDWAQVEPAVRDVLRLGTHQLLGMRVPVHAAVDSSCELARRSGNPGSATGRIGFVNAVLRKVSQRDREGWIRELGAGGDAVEPLALRESHPLWIARAFADSLGPRRAELEALLAADNAPARPVLVSRRGSPAELRALPGVEQTRWSPYGAVLVEGTPEGLAAVREGRAAVQDEGSQLVAMALADAPLEGPDSAWLDLCAGPGGKAALLGWIGAERGAGITAVEQHAHRAELVHTALAGLADARVLTADATSRPWGAQRFDRVLVDAPCTGIGALRRRPESRWRRTPADLAALGPVQRELLSAAADATRHGGVIAYATCSPHLAETELVVGDVCRRHGGLEVLDAHAVLPQVPDCGDGPYIQLWPHRHGTDAMFLALLRRTDA